MAYQKTAPKRYFTEVMVGAALFVCIVFLVRSLIHHTTNSALITAERLLPVLPLLLVAAAVWRLYRNSDEFVRHNMIKTSAAAGLMTALFFAFFPFLHVLVKIPPVPQRFPFALLVLSFSYILCGLVFSFLDKRAEGGTVFALGKIAPALPMFLAPLAYWLASLVLPLPAFTFFVGLMCFAAVAIISGFYQIFIRRQNS